MSEEKRGLRQQNILHTELDKQTNVQTFFLAFKMFTW